MTTHESSPIRAAALLLGPLRDNPGIDPEYRRALVELCVDLTPGIGMDYSDIMDAAIDAERGQCTPTNDDRRAQA